MNPQNVKVCANCSKPFIYNKKDRRYNRLGLFSKFRHMKDCTPASILEQHYNVTVTPGRDDFICTSCEMLLLEMHKTEDTFKKFKFRKISSKVSYISTKIKSPIATPSPSKKRPKRHDNASTSSSQTTTSSPFPKSKIVSTEISRGKSRMKFITEEGIDKSKTKQKLFQSSLYGQKKTPTLKSYKQKEFPTTKFSKAIEKLLKRNYKSGLRDLMNSSASVEKAFMEITCEKIRHEAENIANSTLLCALNTMFDLENFTWENCFDSLLKKSPLLVNVIVASLTTPRSHKYVCKRRKKKIISLVPTACSIPSQIAFTRNKKSSFFQNMNSTKMWFAGCKRKLFTSFNKLGLCMSIKSTMAGVDKLRADYDQKVHSWKESVNSFFMKDVLDDEWENMSTDSELSGVHIIGYQKEHQSSNEPRNDLTPFPTEHVTDSDSRSPSSASTNSNEHIAQHADEKDTESESSSTEPFCYLYDITFDNVNQKIHTRHYTRNKENEMMNMVQAFATKDRVPCGHLSNEQPSPEDIRNISIKSILPNQSDEMMLKNEMQIICNRIIQENITCFEDANACSSIANQYSKFSSKKSAVVPLGVLKKDETRTADMIDILEEYHKYIPTSVEGNPVPIPLYCDGLSCERADTAQKARRNGEDDWDKLLGLEPSVQEWHRRQIQLQDTYDELFKIESQRVHGTLYHIKQAFGHKEVSKDVSSCFNVALDMLHFATEAHVVGYVMNYLKTKGQSEKDLKEKTPEERKVILEEATASLVSYIWEDFHVKEIKNIYISPERAVKYDYCLCRTNRPGEMMVYCDNKNCKRGTWFHIDCIGMAVDDIPAEEFFCSQTCKLSATLRDTRKSSTHDNLMDRRSEYARRLIWRGLSDLVRDDAVKENDGPRMIRHWKFDLIDFHEKHHPKYVIYTMKLLININGGVSPRLAHQLTWSRTVNVHGGKRKNKPKDLHNEHINKKYKENSKVSLGQLTENTVQRHSQLIGIEEDFELLYNEKVLMIRHREVRGSGHFNRQDDIKELSKLLVCKSIFEAIGGRKCHGFNEIKHQVHTSEPKKLKIKMLKIIADVANMKTRI